MMNFSKQICIDGRPIGHDSPTYIIAEAGVAHFGEEEKAYRLVDLAKSAGADAVKFQVFDVNALISKELEDWIRRLGSRQLPFDAFERIQAYCKEQEITFFATAHDETALEFLQGLEVPAYKIGSGEVGNWPYLSRIAALGKPVIFSTGMYQSEQISQALETLHRAGNTDIAVLHCITQYPAPPQSINLDRINQIRDRHQVITGYSDHTAGFHIPLAAVTLGAAVIEKHISIDFNVPDAQDWKVSCGPQDLKTFIDQVRDIESALAVGTDGPTPQEMENAVWATKSITLARDLPRGSVIHREDLTFKRPGTGISPSRLNEVIGRTSIEPLTKDTLLTWENLS